MNLRYGAGAGEKSGKVTIEEQGGGASNDTTAPPAILDQVPGRALKESEGGGDGSWGGGKGMRRRRVRERTAG